MLWHGPKSDILAVSPDRELFEENIVPGDGNPLIQFRLVRANGTVLGVDVNNFYTFALSDLGDLEDAELNEFQEEVDDIVALYPGGAGAPPPSGGLVAQAIAQQGTGGVSLVPAGGSGVPAPPLGGGGLIGAALAQTMPTLVDGFWVFAQTAGKFSNGTRVPSDLVINGLKSKGVAALSDGTEAYVRFAKQGAAGPALNEKIQDLENERVDGRVLPISRDLNGVRYLDFRSALDKFIPSRDDDYPIAGPITGAWLMRFMWENGGGPMSFHHRFLSEARLDYTAGGMSEHMTLCKALELAIGYDHIDIGRSASCELLCRKLQMIHDRWKHKLPNVNATSSSTADDESFLLLGTHETRGNIGISPELTQWLGGELGKLASVDKERRKAREERALSLKK